MNFSLDPAKKSDLLDVLENKEFWPNKVLGQNFLISTKIRDDIVRAADLNKKNLVIEIGSGIGPLTIALAQKCSKVLAIEKDQQAANVLKEVLRINDIKNVEIIIGDVLKSDLSKIIGKKKYKVVANLPYYLTSRFFRNIFQEKNIPELIVVMIQKEVAHRIIAKEPDHSQLSLSIQIFSDPKICLGVKSGNFWPRPKVDSSVLKLSPKKNIPDNKLIERFFILMHAGFSSKRKILLGNLSHVLKIEKTKLQTVFEQLKIKENVRAQELSLDQWIELSKNI